MSDTGPSTTSSSTSGGNSAVTSFAKGMLGGFMLAHFNKGMMAGVLLGGLAGAFYQQEFGAYDVKSTIEHWKEVVEDTIDHDEPKK